MIRWAVDIDFEDFGLTYGNLISSNMSKATKGHSPRVESSKHQQEVPLHSPRYAGRASIDCLLITRKTVKSNIDIQKLSAELTENQF
jgi:hypothetical protein